MLAYYIVINAHFFLKLPENHQQDKFRMDIRLPDFNTSHLCGGIILKHCGATAMAQGKYKKR
jgi:hypothetical protein